MASGGPSAGWIVEPTSASIRSASRGEIMTSSGCCGARPSSSSPGTVQRLARVRHDELCPDARSPRVQADDVAERLRSHARARRQQRRDVDVAGVALTGPAAWLPQRTGRKSGRLDAPVTVAWPSAEPIASTASRSVE